MKDGVFGDDGTFSPTSPREVQPTDRIAIAYTILNSGKPDDQKIDTLVTNIIGSVAGSIPVVGSALKQAASVWAQVFSLVDPDCDGPVVADSIMGTGADFARWTQQGPLRRTLLAPGVDSATGCGSNSYYEVTYSIAPAALLPTSFSLRINAKTAASTVGARAKMLPAPTLRH